MDKRRGKTDGRTRRGAVAGRYVRADGTASAGARPRLEAIGQHLPGIIYRRVLKADGRIEYPFISGALKDIYGLEPEMVRRDPGLLLDTLHPDDRPGFFASLKESAARLARWDHEFRIVDRAGAVHWMHGLSTPSRRRNGDVVWDGLLLDVTRRRWSEENLRHAYDDLENLVAQRTAALSAEVAERRQAAESLRKLSRAVEQSASMVLIARRDGTIEYVNPRFCEVTGYRPEEVIGRTPRLLGSGDKTREDYDGLWDAVNTVGEWRGEFRNRRKDGSVFWASATISAVRDEAGQVTHFVAIEEDVTERRTYETALQAAKEQAEAANRAKSEFLSSMSHELRTPLNAILGFGQLLEMELRGPLAPSQHDYVEQILKAGRHLLDLINDVLDLAKIEAKKVTLSPETVPAAAVAEECVELAAPLAAERGIRIEPPAGPASAVRADYIRLKQVLMNLLGNAVKYNREGGTVAVSWQGPADGRVRITVADTGHGIPPERQGELFQPFSRLGAEATSVEGTGIGLAICKRLVEMMDGRIGFESTPGVGSTFWVELPAAGSAALRAARPRRVVSPSPPSARR